MLFGSYFGFQFVATLYLQTMNGWSAIETALAFLPAGLLVAVFSPRLGALMDRFGTQRIIAAGSASLLLGYLLFLRWTAPDVPGLMLPTMLLLGTGFALMYPALNIQAVAGVPDHEQGLASGLLNTSFQVGGAIGLAIVSAIVSSVGRRCGRLRRRATMLRRRLAGPRDRRHPPPARHAAGWSSAGFGHSRAPPAAPARTRGRG